MRVLVACEESGIVRDAFLARGHDAYSCDILPRSHPRHITGDVLEHLADGWDMMIAFPPCTHLCVSGARHFERKRRTGEQQAAINFFMAMVNAPIQRIAVENPVGIMSNLYRKPDQIIQPFQFGHPESKKTCLWLKDLPPLATTNVLSRPAWVRCECCDDFLCTIHRGLHVHECSCPDIDTWARRGINPYFDGGRWDNQTPSGQNKLGPSPQRAAVRSTTYSGIAVAMADQWGNLSAADPAGC